MSGTSRAAAKTSRTLLRAFGGLNETYSCTEAEAGRSKNFSSRDFPALSTRIPRRRLRSVVQMNGIYHLNGLLVAAGKNLIYNSDETPQEAEFFWNAVADSKKKMVGMGTRVIIFPDKIAFDTRDRSVTKLGAVWDSGGADVVLIPCDAAGKTYTVSGKGTKEPENPADGQLFLKVNNIQKPYSSESVLEIYNEASGNWSAIELKWCRIEAGGIGRNFAVWDTVTVSGVEDGDDLHWKELKGDRIVTARGDDWVQVQAEPGGDYFYGTLTKGREMLRWTGIDGKGATMEGNTDAFRLERRVPDLDYLTECDNRLWGCAQAENIIYGCKLGDPTNWFSYRGIAEDSYAVTVGSDGPFTGAATCLGSVLFFKERLTLRRVAALVLAFGGCVLVSGLGGGGLTPLGLLIGLCSGIGYGLYSILGSVALRKYEPLTVTTYAFLFSAAGSWFICRPAEMLSIASSLPPLSFALDVLSIAVVTAVAPYLLYTLGLKNTPASKAAIMATVEPLVATVLGIVVFSEPLTPAAAAGIILILAAIVLLNAHRKE